ncbi:hypothetical protein DMENIID0001_041610 [Sergentomyia squamirostris]
MLIKVEVDSEDEVEVEESIVTEETEVYQPRVAVMERKLSGSLEERRNGVETSPDQSSYWTEEYSDIATSYTASPDHSEDFPEPEMSNEYSEDGGKNSPYTYSFQDVYGPDICPMYQYPVKTQTMPTFKSAVDSISFKLLPEAKSSDHKLRIFPELQSVKTSTDSGRCSTSSRASPLPPPSPRGSPEPSSESDNDQMDQDPDFIVKTKKPEMTTGGKKRNRNTCSVCGIQCSGKYAVKQHMLTHTEGIDYKCSHCSKAFKYEKNLRTHFYANHGDVSCPVCRKKYNSPKNLYQHIKFHLMKHHLATKEAASASNKVPGKMKNPKTRLLRTRPEITVKPTKEDEIKKEKERIERERAQLEAERERIEAEKRRIQDEKTKIEAEKKKIQAERRRVEMAMGKAQLSDDIKSPKSFKTKQKIDKCSNSAQLQVPKIIHSNKKRFPCDRCPKTFKYRRGVNEHIKRNRCFPEEKPPPETLEAFPEVEHELPEEKPELPEEEPEIPEEVKKEEEMQESAETIKISEVDTTPNKHNCPICKKLFRYESSIQKHLESWHTARTCNICGHISYSSIGHYHHQRTHKLPQHRRPRSKAFSPKKKPSKAATSTT